jgi:hypothetical protein
LALYLSSVWSVSRSVDCVSPEHGPEAAASEPMPRMVFRFPVVKTEI